MHLENVLSGTRGQIVGLVRAGRSTVSEIAANLKLTPNNIRAHLTALERDGVIELAGRRIGARKPSNLYQLTSAAEALYSRAYEPVMIQFVDVLCSRGSKLRPEFDEVGRRMAESLGPMEGWSLAQRLEALGAALRKLGATPSVVEEQNGEIIIRSHQCPLASLVSHCPDACAIGLSLITEVTGRPVTEHCIQGARPECVFSVELHA